MDLYAVGISSFIGGFIVGAALCFVVIAKIYKNKKVKDEILKSKREAVKSQRTLDLFIKTSLDVFNELDAAHRQYVQFLRESVQKIAPQEEDLHLFLNAKGADIPVYDEITEEDPEDDEEGIKKTNNDRVIPTPTALKNPEIPKTDTKTEIESILKTEKKETAEENGSKVKEENEKPQEEPLKV